jgi:hypothetical protein
MHPAAASAQVVSSELVVLVGLVALGALAMLAMLIALGVFD